MEACSISQHVLHHGEAGEAGGAEPRAPLLWVWDSPGEPVTFPQLPQAEPLTLRTPAFWQAGRHRPASPFLQLARPQLGSP